MLLRLLFPSWAFFDVVTDVPRLDVRSWRAGSESGVWRPALVAPRRGIRHLLYNPEGTEHLALQALVDRFAVECEAGDRHAVTVALLTRLAARAAAEPGRGPHAAHGAASDTWSWQWRIGAASTLRDADVTGDFRVLYESEVLALCPNQANASPP
ncbi:hypothetical protein [Gemmatimonas sp.]